MAKKKTKKKSIKKPSRNGKAKKDGDSEHRRQDVRNAIDAACDQLNTDNVDPRDYVEQLAWMFFLKAFDETEKRKEDEAVFEEKAFKRRLPGNFGWSEWTKLTNKPDDMLKFVNGDLWDKLTSTGKGGMGDDAIGERFRRVFSTVKNHCRRGTSLARVVEQVNRIEFSKEADVIALSEMYEHLLKKVASDSAGYAGEFYTQRHIIQAMIDVVKPKLQDRIYDPCFGTAGFLALAADYIRANLGSISGKQQTSLQNDTFFGREAKERTYLFGTMNMLLHRIEGAHLEPGDTLEAHSANVSEKEKYDVVLANPPYGGKMQRELQSNFTIKSSATECLFLQHIMANLAKGGRAAVIVPEGVLYRGGPDEKVRRRLISEFNVHTILSLPAKCFLPYTAVKTNVLFFDRPKKLTGKATATQEVWFYELTNDGFELKQTRKPIQGSQLPDFLNKQPKRSKGDNSWSLSYEDLEEQNFDLSATNPHSKNVEEHRPALEIVKSIRAKENRIVELLEDLAGLLDS